MNNFSLWLKCAFTGENPRKVRRKLENQLPEPDGTYGIRRKSPREIIREQQMWVGCLIFMLLSAAMLFPFAVLLHRVFPVTGWTIPVIVYIISILVLFYFLRKVKFTIWTLLGLGLVVLTITTAVNKYTYKDLYYGYRGFIYNVSNERKSLHDVFTQKPFPRYRDFLKSSHFTPVVRQYSLKTATKNFTKYQKGDGWQYVQYFSIFKDINSKWQYVSDPVHRDYIAPAAESLETFCGDCDDYSVLIAACITSIGGTVRLVRTESHVYPELKIENKEDFPMVKNLIRKKLFRKEVAKKGISYHTDGYGDIWINLDYTAKYPGGKFLYNDVVSVLEIP